MNTSHGSRNILMYSRINICYCYSGILHSNPWQTQKSRCKAHRLSVGPVYYECSKTSGVYLNFYSLYILFISKWECSSWLRSRVDCQLNIKTSLVAILIAVLDVFSICFALDADLLIPRHVRKLNGHQRLQVVRMQQFAVVGVVLERKTFAHAEVLDLSNLVTILFSLQTQQQRLSPDATLFALLQIFQIIWCINE